MKVRKNGIPETLPVRLTDADGNYVAAGVGPTYSGGQDATLSATGTIILGTDGDNSRLVKTDSDGHLQVDVLSGSNIFSIIQITGVNVSALNPVPTRLYNTLGNELGTISYPLITSGIDGASSITQYTEDVASVSDPIGIQLISRRRDLLNTGEVSADGDSIAINSTQRGELYVKHEDPLVISSISSSVGASINGIDPTLQFQVTGWTAIKVLDINDNPVPVYGIDNNSIYTLPTTIYQEANTKLRTSGLSEREIESVSGSHVTLIGFIDSDDMNRVYPVSYSSPLPTYGLIYGGTVTGASIATAYNPIRVAAVARNSTKATSAMPLGRLMDLVQTLGGKLVNFPYTYPEEIINSGGTITTNSDITFFTGTTSKYTYITDLIVTCSHASVSSIVSFYEGSSSGRLLWHGYAASSGGGFSQNFSVPIRTTGQNAPIIVKAGTNGSEIQVCIQGFKAEH